MFQKLYHQKLPIALIHLGVKINVFRPTELGTTGEILNARQSSRTYSCHSAKKLRAITGLVTGHYPFNYHLNKRGKSDTGRHRQMSLL